MWNLAFEGLFAAYAETTTPARFFLHHTPYSARKEGSTGPNTVNSGLDCLSVCLSVSAVNPSFGALSGRLEGCWWRRVSGLFVAYDATTTPTRFPSFRALSTLEANQGQIDGFLSQLPYNCHQNRVAYVGDGLEICPWVASRVVGVGLVDAYDEPTRYRFMLFIRRHE